MAEGLCGHVPCDEPEDNDWLSTLAFLSTVAGIVAFFVVIW